jgi:hypothetical protein
VNNDVKKLSLYLTLGKHEVIKGESQNVVLVVVRDKIKVESEFVENNESPACGRGLTNEESDNNRRRRSRI